MTRIPRPRTRGFSLLEVMVAVFIISIGVLGIAAMQANAIASTHSSQIESLVAIEAQSLASSMTANPWWNQALFPPTITVNGSTITPSTMASSTNCQNTACTGAELASYDLATWGTELQKLAPGAQASIACQSGQPIICTITVTWTPESNIAMNGGTTSNTATQLSYTLVNQF